MHKHVRPTSICLGVSLTQMEPQGAPGGLVLGGTRGREVGEQDGSPWPAERVNLAAVWTSITAAMCTLGL